MTKSRETKMIRSRLECLLHVINDLPLPTETHGLRDALDELTACVIQLTLTLDPDRPPPVTLAQFKKVSAECRQEGTP